MEELVSSEISISEDAAQLMKFHGSYQQVRALGESSHAIVRAP